MVGRGGEDGAVVVDGGDASVAVAPALVFGGWKKRRAKFAIGKIELSTPPPSTSPRAALLAFSPSTSPNHDSCDPPPLPRRHTETRRVPSERYVASV